MWPGLTVSALAGPDACRGGGAVGGVGPVLPHTVGGVVAAVGRALPRPQHQLHLLQLGRARVQLGLLQPLSTQLGQWAAGWISLFGLIQYLVEAASLMYPVHRVDVVAERFLSLKSHG